MALDSGTVKKVIAVDDFMVTKPGVAVDIPVLDNDELLTGGGAYTVVIHGSTDELSGDQLTAPSQGTVIVKPDGKITYTPNNDTWEGIDMFEYQIYYPGSGMRSNKAKVYVLVLDMDAITCDNSRTIQLDIPTSVTCTWYTTQSGSTIVPTGNDILTVNRNDEEQQGDYFVDRWLAINIAESSDLFPNRISARTRFVPLLMYWKKSVQDKDWNNPNNWEREDGQAFAPDMQFVPWGCTVVHIPAGANLYPSLDIATGKAYNGHPDNEPVCDEIHFEHGGEVVRTDLLHYNKAHVELTLEANRWNMLSAPLRYVFPGDYYKTDPCPHADELRIYQQLFAMQNPQTGQEDTNPQGGWTGAFNNPEVAMPAGFGYAIQLLDEGKLLDGRVLENETHWTPLPKGQRHSIWLPKNDTQYNIYIIYSSDGKGNPPFRASCDIYDTRPLNRGTGFDNYRFIYEGGDGWGTGSWTGNITLNTSGASDAKIHVIVGNPFMAHWDFTDFYSQNSTLIKEEYKVLESDNDGAFTTYSPLLPLWDSKDKMIAPMQSVLVKSLTAFGKTDLKTRVTSMAQNAGVILKSASTNPNLLKIVASKDGKQNHSHILFETPTSNNSLFNENSYKLFVADVTEPVAVYTRSSEGFALDINVFGNCKEMIPVGIRTSQTGHINLQFEGIENFLPEAEVFLLDTQTGTKINLRETPEYSFEKTTSELFMDGRFYLSVSKSTPSDPFAMQGAISIFAKGNRLQVVSGNVDIEEAQVFDIQGRLIHKAANIGNPVYTCELPHNGIFVVKVLTSDGITVKKITTNPY